MCVIQPISPDAPTSHLRKENRLEPHLSVPDGSTLTNQLGSTSSPGGPGLQTCPPPPPPPWGPRSTTPPSLLALITPLIPRKLCRGKEGEEAKKKKKDKTKRLAAHESPSINMDDFHANAEGAGEQWQKLDFVSE